LPLPTSPDGEELPLPASPNGEELPLEVNCDAHYKILPPPGGRLGWGQIQGRDGGIRQVRQKLKKQLNCINSNKYITDLT